jgi:hypothetical protein
MWHDVGLSLLVFFRQAQSQEEPPRRMLSTLDELADTTDRLSQLAALVLARYLDTISRALRYGMGAHV